MTRTILCTVEELPERTVRVFELDEDLRVAVARSGSTVFAVEDRCSHDDGELGEGHLLGDDAADPEIECPRHGGRFRMTSGQATRMPAVAPIEVIPAGVEDGRVWVEAPEY
jgi:3-phenylpropionate/trans-cinnamate dioxygenase ferredoxin subunit